MLRVLDHRHSQVCLGRGNEIGDKEIALSLYTSLNFRKSLSTTRNICFPAASPLYYKANL